MRQKIYVLLHLFKKGGKLLIKSEWVSAIWVILGVLMFFTAFSSQNVVMMTLGLALSLGHLSVYLTSNLKSDHVVIRGLEVVFAVASVGIIIYGYVVTQSLMFGLIIIFVSAMIFIGFTLGYLLPKIRNKPKNTN